MFNRLVKNELIKQYNKIGIVILTALVLLISIVSPIVIKVMDDRQREEVNLTETVYSMEIIDEQLAKTPKTEGEKVTNLVYQARKENLMLAQELKFETTDWRHQLLDSHLIDAITRELIGGMIDGIKYEDIQLNADGYDFDVVESLADASLAKLTQSYNNLTAQIEEYEQVMRNNDYVAGTSMYIQDIDNMIEKRFEAIERLEREVQDEQVLLDIEFNKQTIERLEADKVVLQKRIDDQIPYDDDDWKSKTIDQMLFYNVGVYQSPMSESEFYLYGFKDVKTYEQYLEITNQNIESRKNNLHVLTYSLEIGQPSYNLFEDARTSTYFSLEITIIAVTVLLIFMGCGIMSSEFSKGTIRMLVARPVKRQMIFLAKLMMLVVVGLGLVIASAILSTLVSGIAFSFSDFALNVVKSTDGVISSHNFFVFLLSEMIVTFGGMALVIALLITLSTVTKSAVFTLGGTMILYMLSAPIGALFISSSIVRNSILPYMNIGMIRLVPDLYNSVWGMGYDLNLIAGAIALVLFAAVISIVGCIVFVKKDIRN